MKKLLTTAIASMFFCAGAMAASTAVLKSPFPDVVPASQILPEVASLDSADGLHAGAALLASAGAPLFSMSITTKTTPAIVEGVTPFSLTAGHAHLVLRAGERLTPAARLIDSSGHLYYLVKADPKATSAFFRNRYFAVAEDGHILDHAFRQTWHGGYQTSDVVVMTSGDYVVTKDTSVSPALCSMSVKFLGAENGVAKYRVIRIGADGQVDENSERAFTNNLRAISLSGVNLSIDQIATSAVKAHVTGFQPITCNGPI